MSYDAYIWHISDREERSEWEALFIHALLEWVKAKTGKEYKDILDTPCGNGRLHPFLKRFGYKVRGFDISGELVEEAKKLGRACWVGDLRDPKAYRGKHDVIINWFTSFGYFNHEENVRTMENFYEALRPWGVLLLDFPIFGKGFADRDFTGAIKRGEDLLEVTENVVEGKKSTLRIRLFKDLDDRLELVREVKVNVTMYAPEELEEMMKSAGFREVHTFETMKTMPPDEKSRRITFVAVK